MGNAYIEEGLRRAQHRVDDRLRKELKAMKQKENVEAFVGFASNLFNVLDGSRISTMAPKAKATSAAFKSFKSAPKDYNGVIAGNMFGVRFSPALRGANNNV